LRVPATFQLLRIVCPGDLPKGTLPAGSFRGRSSYLLGRSRAMLAVPQARSRPAEKGRSL
jgi:hypothetical protein